MLRCPVCNHPFWDDERNCNLSGVEYCSFECLLFAWGAQRDQEAAEAWDRAEVARLLEEADRLPVN